MLLSAATASAQNTCGTPGTCPAPANNGCGVSTPCPAGCSLNGVNLDVGPTNQIVSHPPFIPAGDPRGVINYNLVASVSGGGLCNVTGSLLRFWSPAVSAGVTSCASNTAPTFSQCIPLLEAGGAPVAFAAPGVAALQYTVQHAHEVPSPLFNPNNHSSFPFEVDATVCICGTSQTALLTEAVNFRTIRTPVIHPEIMVTKSANITTICQGVSTPVTYTYLVTNPGDVDLNNIMLTDTHCGPVTPVTAGGFNIGDVNMNNRLERAGPQGETWTFQCMTSISMTTTNTVTATGTDIFDIGGAPTSLGITVMDTDDETVTANPRPVCTAEPSQGTCDPAATLTATGNTCGPYTCTWTKDGAPIAGGTNCTLTATGVGVYCATVTDCNGCVSENPCCVTVTTGPTCTDEGITDPSPPITVCPSAGPHCITATIGNTTPATTYDWDLVSGNCSIISGEFDTTLCFSITDGSCVWRITASTPGCTPPAVCHKTVTCPPATGQGRTPGFWKQEQHWGHWPAPYCAKNSCPCGPATLFCDVFDCDAACDAAQDYFEGKTLLKVLQGNGGGFIALGRHAVAALLNSAHPDVDYLYPTDGPGGVITLVNQALADCAPNPLKDLLAAQNELEGGSLGGQCFCINPCPGGAMGQGAPAAADINADGKVNQADLDFLLMHWASSNAAADLDGNGVVGPNDLDMLLRWWGR